MTRNAVILFLLILAASAGAKSSGEQAYSLFNQANEAFRAANSASSDTDRTKLYEKSILLYEKIINDGQVNNAKLYYNLGNAYFLKEDIGRAILNYRRAEKLDGSDINIQKNLSFARSRRFDKVTPEAEKRVLQTLFFWHYDFSLKTKFTLTCVFFAVVCISLTALVWLGRKVPLLVAAVIFGILTLCLLASVIVETRTSAGRICGVITDREVIARQGDGQNYPASFKESLHAGTEFDLLEHRPGWLHIKLTDNSDGWIPDSAAALF